MDTWWDQHATPASAAECQAVGEQALIGTLRGWHLPGGALACLDDTPGSPSWGGRITGVDIYFPAHTEQQQAISIAAAVLPIDATLIATFDGANPDYSTIHTGTCRELLYTSAALANAVTTANPSWTADPAKATITLYSGQASSSDGADRPYISTAINLALVTIGEENRGIDGVIHC